MRGLSAWLLAWLLVVSLLSGIAGAVSYPTSVVTIPQRNTGDFITADFFNVPNSEIAALESALLVSGFAHGLKPSSTNAFDLGTALALWRNAYLAGTLFGTQGTLTANLPFLSLTATWNNAAVNFQGLLINIINTASANPSKLIETQISGTDRFYTDTGGNVYLSGALGIGSAVPDATVADVRIVSILTGVPTVLIRAIAAQTGDLLQTQSSGGVASAGITVSGAGYFGATGVSSTEALRVTPLAAANVGMVLRGLSGQTGDLTQWQTNVGTIVTGVSNAGALYVGRSGVISTEIASFTPGAASLIAVIIRGLASQTGDLLDIQTSGASNIFQFTALASMVNGLQFNPANTGGSPSVIAIGSDPNITVLLDSKGTGFVRLLSAGADIQWGKPLVALGGGLAPTLGTIGGTGPATAAQNSWMRGVDSTGAAFWVPVWK